MSNAYVTPLQARLYYLRRRIAQWASHPCRWWRMGHCEHQTEMKPHERVDHFGISFTYYVTYFQCCKCRKQWTNFPILPTRSV